MPPLKHVIWSGVVQLLKVWTSSWKMSSSMMKYYDMQWFVFVHCWRFQLTLELTLAPCSLVRNQDSQEISCGQVSIHVRASTPPAQLKSSWATGSATEDLMRWIRIGSKNTDGGTLWQRITWNASGMLDVMKLLSRNSKDPFDSVPAFNNANNGTGRTELEAKQQTSQIHTKPITSSSRASRGRKFQKKKELYSKERICL